MKAGDFMSQINFSLIAAEEVVYEGLVDMVVAEGQVGQLGILPEHIPLITPLKIGPMKVKVGEEERLFAVYGGFLEVKEDRVVVLARDVDRPEDVSVEETKRERAKLEEALTGELTDEERRDLEGELKRVETQILIAG